MLKPSQSVTSTLAITLALLFSGAAAHASKEPTQVDIAGIRTGHGQTSPEEPLKLKNLKLDDPLVQQAYLNDADMLRFLRGGYTEACARGLVVNALTEVKQNVDKKYPKDAAKAADSLLSAGRVWRMGSFELEALAGGGYLNAANYCDCIMKELPDSDLVNTKKGLKTLQTMPDNVKVACQMRANELTDKQIKFKTELLKKSK